QQHDDGERRHERRGVAVEERPVAAPGRAVAEHGDAGGVAAAGAVPEAARRIEPGGVRQRRRERGQQQQELAPLLPPLRRRAQPLHRRQRRRGHDDVQRDVREHQAEQRRDVGDGEHVPADPGGVGAHEREQVEHHGGAEHGDADAVAADAAVEQHHDDDERRDEGGGVAVEEGEVAAVERHREHRVAGGVATRVVGPHAAGRVEAGVVGDAGHQRGQ
ncbi:hypothetical protein EE612_033462, partial [Oryza sativa]